MDAMTELDLSELAAVQAAYPKLARAFAKAGLTAEHTMITFIGVAALAEAAVRNANTPAPAMPKATPELIDAVLLEVRAVAMRIGKLDGATPGSLKL